jgi:hypothetical protein
MNPLTSALLAPCVLGSVASAQFWPVVSTTTNMGTSSTYQIANLTNRSGLSATNLSATHSANWQQMWLSNGIVTGWVQFDLGSPQPVRTIAVWNYNSSISTTRGVALMDVSTSLDGQSFTYLSTEMPPQGNAAPIAAHLINANGVSARYVKFDIRQNYGNAWTGLSEVQFAVGLCAGAIWRSGTGCMDSGGTPNTLTSTGCPDRGATLSLEMNTSISATGPLFLVIGLSDQSWNGVPLPIDLGPSGASGCSNYIAHTLVLGAPAPVNGRATLDIPIPFGGFLLGVTGYAQFFHLDAPANALGLVASDYLTITIG